MEEAEKKVIEIKPLSKWKRILLFLGDYFIGFIIAFALFNLAVFPLAKVICQTQKQNEQAEKYEYDATNLLISSGFLHKSNSGDVSFEEDVNYTFKVFLSYYAFDEESPDMNNPQYGHKKENEVIRTYYVDYKQDTPKYLAIFNEVNKEDSMFTIGETVESITLKSDYKNLLKNELLEITDESKYSVNMTNFRDHIFARLFYVNVYQDILDNDFFKDGVSFNELMAAARKINRSLQWIPVSCSFISLALAWSLVYILYPMINRDNRTPTMSAMRVDKIDYKNLGPINKKTVLIQSFYHLVFSLSYIIILPSLYFGFSYSFNLPILFIASMVCLVMIIASMMFIFFNQHNRSGSDILTFVVLVPTAELDNVYKEKQDEGRIPS